MPLYKLLNDSDDFDGPAVDILTAAYEAALPAIGLRDLDDPLTRLLAETIIKIYRAGVRDSDRLCGLALQELRIPPEK